VCVCVGGYGLVEGGRREKKQAGKGSERDTNEGAVPTEAEAECDQEV
jgi:hypothetical protein